MEPQPDKTISEVKKIKQGKKCKKFLFPAFYFFIL